MWWMVGPARSGDLANPGHHLLVGCSFWRRPQSDYPGRHIGWILQPGTLICRQVAIPKPCWQKLDVLDNGAVHHQLSGEVAIFI
jgi:hypothetical protein